MSATPIRLVLLEDNAAVRRATELTLELEGFQVIGLGSAGECEDILNTPRGDEILLADFRLEGPKTGIDVLLGLRQRTGSKIPAVIMSGDLPSVMQSIKKPIPDCAFVSKPLSVKALVAAIRSLSGPG